MKNVKPAYDEATIFNDPYVVLALEMEFNGAGLKELVHMYSILNSWHIPLNLAKILGIPTYLYDSFAMLPMGIKSKTITPLMGMIKEAIVKKCVAEFEDEEIELSEPYTWEIEQKR